ncbi:MAG: universal stress protein, partial [Anaerolineaceae bacterium]
HDFMFGSIAQQVISQQKVAVLLVPPAPQGGEIHLFCGKFLVPLDGNPEHEQSLHQAAMMAKSCGASLHLMVAVPTPGKLSGERAAAGILLPGATAAMLDLNAEAALEYLREKEVMLSEDGIPVSGEVSRGDPAGEIGRAANDIGAELVVLGTHGKAGMNAFWAGSLLPKILAQVRRPLLLVPVSKLSR